MAKEPEAVVREIDNIPFQSSGVQGPNRPDDRQSLVEVAHEEEEEEVNLGAAY